MTNPEVLAWCRAENARQHDATTMLRHHLRTHGVEAVAVLTTYRIGRAVGITTPEAHHAVLELHRTGELRTEPAELHAMHNRAGRRLVPGPTWRGTT